MNDTARERLRALHLLAAGTLAMLIYNPAFDTARGRFTIRWIVVPVLALTGAAMWSLPALRRWIRHRRSFRRQQLDAGRKFDEPERVPLESERGGTP